MTAAVVLVLGVGLAGGTAAATTKPPASVKVCVNSKTVLSLIISGKCAKGTHSLAIAVKGATGKTGQAGPAGAAGAPGSNGTNGTNGLRGPSDLYFVDHPYDPSTVVPLAAFSSPFDVMPTTVATVNVPAGTYSVNGVLHIGGGTTGQSVQCKIHAQVGATTTLGNEDFQDVTASNVLLSVAGVVSLSAPGSISIRCGATTTLMAADNWTLQALQVETAHGTVAQPLAHHYERGFTG
jgi:hypothetical protein